MTNVRLLHALALLSGLRFGMGIWVLFYLRLTDYAGIGLAETVTIVTAFAMELPTGIAADRWGRKRCLVTAFGVELVGYLLLAGASGLGGLLVSLAVLQLGKALQSGTFEAMLWESLPAAERARRFVRDLGRANALRLYASAAACLAGGLLYERDAQLPFLAAAGAFGLAAIVGLGLREPPHEVRSFSGTGLREAVAMLGREWRLVFPLLLVGAFLVVSEDVLDDVLAVEFGFRPSGLGALIAVAFLAAAAAAHLSHWLEALLGRRRLVFGMALVGAATLVASPELGVIGGGLTVLLRYALRSVHDTVVAGQLAAASDASLRATVLSIYQAARRLPYVATAWALGAVMDLVTARAFALWFGLAMATAALLAWRLSIAAPGGEAAAAPARASIERW